VPAVITVGYVNAVLAQLNHIYGNAVRLVVKTGTIPPAAVADLDSIYSGQQYQDELHVFSSQLVSGVQLVKSDPGDRVFHVRKILRAVPACISAEVSGDYAAVSITPAADVTLFVVLSHSSVVPSVISNPTAWDISYEMSNSPAGSFCV